METNQVSIIFTFLLLRNKTGKQYTVIQVIQICIDPMQNTEKNWGIEMVLLISLSPRMSGFLSVCEKIKCRSRKTIPVYTHVQMLITFSYVLRYGMFIHRNRGRIINFKRAE